MFPILSDGIAVYVYRKKSDAQPISLEFLQLLRADEDAFHPGSWQIVYGGALEGESAPAAAYRELLEETGQTPLDMHLIEYLETFYFRPKNGIIVMPVFAAHVSSDAMITVNDEHTDFRWIGEQDIDTAFVWRSQREAIAVILDTLRNRSHWLPNLRV